MKASDQVPASFLASLTVVPIWISFSLYEKELFYLSSVGGLMIGLFVLTIGVTIAFVATLILGVPLDNFLRRKGRPSPLYYAILGALLPPLFVVVFGGYGMGDVVGAAVNYIGFGFTGLVVALTFWGLRRHSNSYTRPAD